MFLNKKLDGHIQNLRAEDLIINSLIVHVIHTKSDNFKD
jgi:hypothetical protein